MDALNLFKCLADETRLNCLLLLREQGELCVCELTTALATSQPKVSRHLAQLRECGLLDTRRDGQWIYYRIADALPDWAGELLSLTARNSPALTSPCCQRLEAMGDRPDGDRDFCGVGS